MPRRLIVLSITLAMAAACGGTSSPQPTVKTLNEPADVFETLTLANLGCTGKVTKLSANGAKVALCGPVAGVAKSFLTVGMYPSAAQTKQQFEKNCSHGGWNLFRPGQNWRAIMGIDGGGFPRSVAKHVASVLGTDLHQGCTAA